jgi:PAS domain S-box-containing protein
MGSRGPVATCPPGFQSTGMSPGLRGRPAGDVLRLLAEQASEIAALKAELAERRDQCRAIIANNPSPTWVYSLESFRFLEVNEVAVRQYGWSVDEFLAMTIADIRPRDDVPSLLENVARMRCMHGGVTGPWRHQHKDGTLVQVAVTFLSLPFLGHSARLIIADPITTPRVLGEPTGLSRLSPREREVFCLVARGSTSREIAEKLDLSCKSVETYRARFMMKLCLRTRSDIVQYAIAHGVLAG